MKNRPIDNSFRPRIEAICRHEAGHYIVVRILRFEAGDISIKITDLPDGHYASAEIMLGKGLNDKEDIIEYLEDRIQILFAGVLSETLVDGKVDNDEALKVLENDGKNDYDKSRELIQLLRNIKFQNVKSENEIQSGLDEIWTELWEKAKVIVENDNEIISGVGSRLASELKKVEQEFILINKEINAMPAIKNRFPETISESDA